VHKTKNEEVMITSEAFRAALSETFNGPCAEPGIDEGKQKMTVHCQALTHSREKGDEK